MAAVGWHALCHGAGGTPEERRAWVWPRGDSPLSPIEQLPRTRRLTSDPRGLAKAKAAASQPPKLASRGVILDDPRTARRFEEGFGDPLFVQAQSCQ